MPRNYKSRGATKLAKLMCRQCSEDARSCIGCRRILHQDAFEKEMWRNALSHQRLLLCTNCQQKGLSLYDQQYYFCGGCGNEYGHMNFGRDALKARKRGSEKGSAALRCKKCNDAAEKEVKLQDARARALVARLRGTTAWRCTCRRISRGRRAHAALNNKVHTEKCQLFPAGERRWDGKNVGIELEDLRFLSPRCLY